MATRELATEKVETNSFVLMRLDGHKFSGLTKQKFQKPFDRNFHQTMLQTAQALVDFNCSPLTYTASDEISVLLPTPNRWNFSGRLTKWLSLNAAKASVTFSLAVGIPVEFDCKVFALDSMEDVADYFLGRQANVQANSLNDAFYWYLTNQKIPHVHQKLLNLDQQKRKELLQSYPLPADYLPEWAAQGTLFAKKEIQKEGYNPLTKTKTVSCRPKTFVFDPSPKGEELVRVINETWNLNFLPSDLAQ